MKKVSLWLARLSAFALLLVAAGTGNVAAQELEGGYYYINRTNSNGLFLSYPGENDNLKWRMKESAYEANSTPSEADLPYIFKFVKQDDGTFKIQNMENKAWIGRDPSEGYGEGLGLVKDAHRYQVTYDPNQLGYTMQDVDESNLYWIMSWGDGYASYVANGGPDMNRVWNLIKIDDDKVENMEEPEIVEGSLADGYYLINLPNYYEGNVYMCAAPDENMNYRLQADMIDGSDYDEAFIFHVTKLGNGNYRIKNCGAQNNTYIEPYVYGNNSTPAIFMSGNKELEHKIEFLSTGNSYIYTAGQEFNYHLVSNTGMVETSTLKNMAATWKFIPADEKYITPELKLREAITDAQGGNYVAGTNPGMVPQEALTEFENVIAEALAEAAGTDHTTTIEKIKAAVEKIESQKIPLSDGYYRFVNRGNGNYLIPKYISADGETCWWLGHDTSDEIDPVSYWKVYTDKDGNRVMKNSGSQDNTYIRSVIEGDNWSHLKVTGTSQTTQSFKQISGNMYQIFGSDNLYPYNAGNGNLITNNKDYYETAFWYIEKVADEDISYLIRLNEAITDAAGMLADANVGPNPGQNAGDPTELEAAIKKARDMYNEGTASDTEIDEIIATLKQASDKFAEQDHSMNQVTDGYYYIVSAGYIYTYNNRETAMYTTFNSQLKWTIFEEKAPEFLFKATDNGDGTFALQNVKYLNYVGKYSPNDLTVVMTAEPEVAQTFKYISKEQWNMSNTTDKTPYNLQTYGHDTGGSILLVDGVNTNAWYLRKVTDQQLIDSIINAGVQAGRTQQLKNILVKAEPAYKNTFRYAVNHEDGLIREVNETDPHAGQLWGSQEPGAVNDGYSRYANLIDGEHWTCFQSTWDEGVATPPQPLQVDLRNEPVKDFEFYFGLRDGDWGMKEMWTDVSLYATNDPETATESTVDESKWTFVGRYTDFPTDFEYAGSNRGFYYRITDMDQEYRYLRFLVNSTYEPQANMMYTIGEFQVYKVERDEENSPYNYVPGMKEAADNLKALIDGAYDKIEKNTVTEDDIEKLKTATQAVLDMTPDTDPLESLINSAKDYVAKFDTNDQWGDVTPEEYKEIEDAIITAEEYDHVRPIRSDLDARKAALESAFALYKSQQKQFVPGEWYYIANTDDSRVGNTSEGGTGSIWDTFVYGNVIIAPKSNNTRAAHWDSDADACPWGYYNHATGERDGDSFSDPYTMWRLVDISEDGADTKVYALQNRATGLYLEATTSRSQRVGLSSEPAPYAIKLLASGQYQITCPIENNVEKLPLHASGDGYICLWDGGISSPSSWTLESVPEDIELLYTKIKNNSIQIMSLPFALDEKSAEENMGSGISTYAINGISSDGRELYLKSRGTFEAGEPFIVVANDYENFDAESEETVMFAMPLADEFILNGKTANGLVATIDYTVPGRAGYGIFVNSVIEATADDTGINAHSGYINTGLIVNGEGDADLTITIKEGLLNGVKNVVVNKAGEKVNVYTVDGVLVKRNVARKNATDGLNSGIYIVGKDKILVK